MSALLGFLGVEAAEKGIQNTRNEMTFENFVVQAQKQSIITYRKGCIKSSITGKPLDTPPYGMNSIYNGLYDALVEVGIIKRELTALSVLTWSSKFTISTSISLEAKNIQRLLENNSKDYAHLRECFVIDFHNLSRLLKNYKHNVTDEYEMYVPKRKLGGGRNRRSRHYNRNPTRTQRRRKHRC